MGLLDAIARSLAHISDAQRSYTTFRPFEEDPTAALAEAIERRRRQRVEAFSSSPQGPGSLLDDLVLDPTVRVRYAEKAPLVEILEEDGVDPAASERVFSGSPIAASRSMAPQANGTTINDDDHHHRSSRYRAANFRNGQPIVDVKEMFAVTKRSNPNGLVRFVGDREGWDRCLAEMAEEQHLREMLGDDYVDKQLRKDRNRRRRQRERMNASLQRRVSSMMVSRDTLLEGNSEFGEGEDGSEESSENDDNDGNFSEPEGNSNTNRSRGASGGSKGRHRRGGGGDAVHFDSDDDDARSVYNALERSTAYNVSSSVPAGLGRPPQAPPRRGATAGTSATKGEAAFKSPDGGDDDENDGDALYLEKVRKLKAPRLAPRLFTHVHRCVGTDDMATIMAQSASSGKAVYEGEGGDSEEDRIVGSPKSRTKKGSGAASAGHFSYRGGGGSGRSAGRNEAQSPVAIAGRRAKFIFITLALGAFCFTCLLWAYVSYMRYFLSGDTRFTTGGDYWHDGFPLQTFGYNRTNGTTHIVNVTNDTSFVWVGHELLRVKPGGLSEVFGSPDSVLTMPMLGVAYITCVVSGLVFLFITAVYIVCYVNGLARGAMTADVVRMKQVSDRLRAVDKENAVHMHALTMGAGLHFRGPASGGGGEGEDEENEGDTFGYDYEFEDGERRRARLRSQRRRQQREEERRKAEEEARRQQQQSQLMTSMSAMMASMGMGMVVPNTLPPSWEPEIPADRRVEFNDSVDSRVEVTYGWLRPLLLYPIPLTDVLLADTSKERKKAKGLAIAIFVPAWLLAVIPTIIFFLIAGDAMDTYFISYIARSLGGIDAGVFMGLVGIVLFVLLPLYAVYHRKAGRFVERRYG